MNTGMVSLQNMPQSVMVRELRRYSCWIWQAGSRHMMSYEMNEISRKVRLLCWYFDIKSFRNTRLYGPRHTSTTGVALHITPKQAHVVQKLHSEAVITEEVREKIPFRTIVLQRHATSIRRPRHERHLLQAFLVLAGDFTQFFHHFFVGTRERIQHTTVAAPRMPVTAVQEVCSIVGGT